MMSKIPLIDISDARTGGQEGKKRVAAQINQACIETGFFTVKGHGLDKTMIADAYASFDKFLKLPLAEKNQCRTEERLCLPQLNGYSGLQEENAYAVMGHKNRPSDYVEKFSMGMWILDDDRELPFPAGELGEELRTNMKRYYLGCQQLGLLLTELFAVAVGLPEDFFADKMDNSYDFLRNLYYPAYNEEDIEGETPPGLAAHTDTVLMAIVTNTAGGLEVKLVDGEWITVETEELDHFVVNIGDLMMRWTNDEWISNMHRVTLSDQDRQAMVFFKVVNEDAVIETIPKFCQDTPAKYAPTTFAEYSHEKAKASFGEKHLGE